MFQMGGCIRVLQRHRINKINIDTQKETDYEGLAHMIMETGKSHDLLSINWKLRKPG